MIRKSVVKSMLSFDASMPEAMQKIKQAGFDGLQLGLGADKGDILLDMSDTEIQAITDMAADTGLEIHSIMPSGLNRLIESDPLARKVAIDHFKRALAICEQMGVSVLLVHPGQVSERAPYDLASQWVTVAFHELAPVAEKAGCCLAIENVWNKFLLSPLEARDFVDKFDSPAIRFYFDVGNIILYGFAEQWARILGERIAEVHFKDFRRAAGTGAGFVPLLAGDVNWPAVMRELRAFGYDGYVCAELPSYTHSLDQSLRHIASAIDAILEM